MANEPSLTITSLPASEIDPRSDTFALEVDSESKQVVLTYKFNGKYVTNIEVKTANANKVLVEVLNVGAKVASESKDLTDQQVSRFYLLSLFIVS